MGKKFRISDLKLTNQNQIALGKSAMKNVKGAQPPTKSCYACGIGDIISLDFFLDYNSQYTCIWV